MEVEEVEILVDEVENVIVMMLIPKSWEMISVVWNFEMTRVSAQGIGTFALNTIS